MRYRFVLHAPCAFALAVLAILAPAVAIAASADFTKRADALYERTEYEASLRILAQEPAPDAESALLSGKNYFMLGDYKRATDAFEKALAAAPRNSDVNLWLGRSWGRRAETSNSPMALVYAGRTRQFFEKAVEIDPRNSEAGNDLFDYYLNAPGIVGGGMDKALAAAKRIATERPAEYEFEMAQIAQKRNDNVAAEAHLRRAMQLDPTEAGRVIDVAKFLAKHGRFEESDRLFEKARALPSARPGITFTQAKTDIENHRNMEQARELLKAYLKAALTPEDPPRREAEKLLERLGK